MRDLDHLNAYQHLLLSALALVHEKDLVAIFRAVREHEECCEAIQLLNAELDKGHTLMEALAKPSPLYDLFANDWPEFCVHLSKGKVVRLIFGTNGPPSRVNEWKATMASTGVVKELVHEYSRDPDHMHHTGTQLLYCIDILWAFRVKGRFNWN